MGACCAREQTANNELINSVRYTARENINAELNSLTEKPHLKYESIKSKKTKEEIQLEILINNIKNIFKNKTKIITLIELYNLAILFKDNHTQSKYIIYDMRKNIEQKEDFLKKMNHINYTYNQIKKMKDQRAENFRFFLNNKIIIFIISEKCFDKENTIKRGSETPFEIINLLFNINKDIEIHLLNTTLNPENISSYFTKLQDFLGDKSYEILPYVLFNYNHVTTLYNDGYIFINFSDQKYFSFDSLINDLNNPVNEPSFENKFLRYMNITSIINIDNYSQEKFNNREFQFQKYTFKDINCSKYDILHNKIYIKNLCEWLKNEIFKGHAIYFRVLNYDGTRHDWIFVVIFFLIIITGIYYIEIKNYLKYKINYIENIDKIIDLTLDDDKFYEVFCDYGIEINDEKDNE